MSAIAGLISVGSAPVGQQELSKMTEKLRIHGPNASGRWQSHSCGLASNLLPITPEDSDEHQPLRRGSLTLVGALRLNDRSELIRKLGLGATYNTRLPDSELVLSAYQKWQEQCIDHLMGAFVFAIWNEIEQSLFLARDQTGEKTVFYHQSPEYFAFASMPKGLFALPWVSRELNEEKLAEFLTLNHSSHGTSFYKGIHRLPPGHCLTFRNGAKALRKYWELDLEQRIVLKSDDEYVEQGRELLETCIRDALRSASPVGAMMSGGLDSSTVACIAAKLLEKEGKRLPTFTEVPHLGPVPETETHYGDETPYIEAIQTLNPNIAPHFVPGLQKGIFDGADERLAILEAPHRNPINQVWMEQICESAASQGIKVLLTGQSGNMSLSYDGLWQLPGLLKSLHWIRLAREIRYLAKAKRTSIFRLVKSKIASPLLPKFIRSQIALLKRETKPWERYSAINPEFARSIKIDTLFQKAGFDASFRPPNDGRLARSIAMKSIDFLGESQCYFLARAGTELRDPLADPRFTQWTIAIPESQFLRLGTPRWLATRLAKPYLPTQVIQNTKRGLQAADWAYHVESQLPVLKEELSLCTNSEACQRFLNIKSLNNDVNEWPGPEKPSPIRYRARLCRAMVVARFLRSLEN